MHRSAIIVALALFAACAPQPRQDIETDFTQRIEMGGLSGTALAGAYVDSGLLRTATQKYDVAMADFNLAISTAPDMAEAYVWRDAVMGAKGDKAGALCAPVCNRLIQVIGTNLHLVLT